MRYSLESMARRGLIPTPTAGDAFGSGSRNTTTSAAHAGVSLTDYVRGDGGKGRGGPPKSKNAHKATTNTECERLEGFWGGTQGNRKSPNLGTVAAQDSGQSGRLNPEWVEWLMGWPIGWTDLKPLAMDRFREWQRQHGGGSAPDAGARKEGEG